MGLGRILRLEWPVVAGPETALPVVALLLLTALHAAGPAVGPESWRALFVENCQSLLPPAIALAAVPALLRDAEHGRLEGAAVLPVRAVALARLAIVIGGSGLLAALWLTALSLLWPPVALLAGLGAALGPTLLLAGLGLLAGTLAGRATVGYLVVLGWPLGDLVLRLLGAFQAIPALQWLDVFAYRWPAAGAAWPAVAQFQGVCGLVLLAALVAAARTLLRRLL